MGESLIQLTEGVGKKAHTYQRTIGGNNVEDGVVIPGEHYLASYSVVTQTALSVATNGDHLVQIMAGVSTLVRIRRVSIFQVSNAGTAGNGVFALRRLTTAGTGGTAITPGKYDNGDTAAASTAMTLPAARGTEGSELFRMVKIMRAAVSANEQPGVWEQQPGMKPIVIPTGVANGIALVNAQAVASATVFVVVEYVETSFV